MLITKMESAIKVSAINVPFTKSLRCVNAAEGDIIFGRVSPNLKAEGYVASMCAEYNLYLQNSENIEKYGTQDLYITVKQAKGLRNAVQCFLENSIDGCEYDLGAVQNTSILPNRYGMVSESSTRIRVSGIGLDLEDYLLIQNKCCNDEGLGIGAIISDEFTHQGYVAIICADICDGSKYSKSTQDLYVTYRQLRQINDGVERLIQSAENLANSGL